MRHRLLCDELDELTHAYDYGIVPGSATVFVRDELNGFGKLDLILLEHIMIVIKVSEHDYIIESCSPLSNDDIITSSVQAVQEKLEVPFETMDNLLMAVSPKFCQRFQKALFDKLESVHQNHQTITTIGSYESELSLQPHLTNIPSSSVQNSTPLNEEQQLNLDQDMLNELHNWIH